MITSDIKTLIIGCGNIAGGFDVDQDSLPSTHVGAYKKHGKFDIIACVDPDKTKLDQFADYWEIENVFLNMKEVKASGLDFDVISICSPTSSHYDDVCNALKLKPKLIFCEKPLASKYEESVDIKNKCKKAGVLLAVNHNRRWDPKVIELRNDIAAGRIGELRSVVGYYNKGILNNGSHMVDLLFNLFRSLNVVSAISPVRDYFEDDPTVTGLLETNSGLPIHLVAAHAAEYELFELQIIGSKKTIAMKNSGLNWSSRKIVENSRFIGYKKLGREQYTEGRYLESMIGAVENIYNAITQDVELLCTGQEACEAHKICSDLLRLAQLNRNIR